MDIKKNILRCLKLKLKCREKRFEHVLAWVRKYPGRSSRSWTSHTAAEAHLCVCCVILKQRSQTWCLPWRCTEATWASSRGQCSSLSPSPGWTRWSWATPTPCVSGRSRNRHAKAQTWAKALAQARRLKPTFLSPPPPPPPPADSSTERDTWNKP